MLLKVNFLANEILEGTDALFSSLDALTRNYSGEYLPRSVLLPKFSWELLDSGLEQVIFDFLDVSYSSFVTSIFYE
jgi:hypothetical protein